MRGGRLPWLNGNFEMILHNDYAISGEGPSCLLGTRETTATQIKLGSGIEATIPIQNVLRWIY